MLNNDSDSDSAPWKLHFHNNKWNISCTAIDEAPKVSPAVLIFKTDSFATSTYTDNV